MSGQARWGGFNGDDHALTATHLSRFVTRGEARYVELGGAFPGRGGNGATAAVERACTAVPTRQWRGSAGAAVSGGRGLALYDCAGAAARIAAQ